MGDIIKVFTGRLILTFGDEFHEVELFNKDKKLKKGFGYIKDSLVYIFHGRLDRFKKSDLKPGIYTKGEEYIFIEPTKTEKDNYSVNNIIELNLDNIFNNVTKDKENFILPKDIELINNNADPFIPTIKEEDDFLKYVVKRIIIEKKINLKKYRDRFPNQYALNNMRSGLQKETKMTVTNFKIWCEILGVKWEMKISDIGNDKLNSLPEVIIIKSDQF